MEQFSLLYEIVQRYRTDWRMEYYGLNNDVDDIFIANHILSIITESRGAENLYTVLDSNPMAAVFNNMEIEYQNIFTELEAGDFWENYTDDCETCPPYDYRLFLKAIRAISEIYPNIHVTNYEQYKDEILSQYIVEYNRIRKLP